MNSGSQGSAYVCLSGAGIKGLWHHSPALLSLLRAIKGKMLPTSLKSNGLYLWGGDLPLFSFLNLIQLCPTIMWLRNHPSGRQVHFNPPLNEIMYFPFEKFLASSAAVPNSPGVLTQKRPSFRFLLFFIFLMLA